MSDPVQQQAPIQARKPLRILFSGRWYEMPDYVKFHGQEYLHVYAMVHDLCKYISPTELADKLNISVTTIRKYNVIRSKAKKPAGSITAQTYIRVREFYDQWKAGEIQLKDVPQIPNITNGETTMAKTKAKAAPKRKVKAEDPQSSMEPLAVTASSGMLAEAIQMIKEMCVDSSPLALSKRIEMAYPTIAKLNKGQGERITKTAFDKIKAYHASWKQIGGSTEPAPVPEKALRVTKGGGELPLPFNKRTGASISGIDRKSLEKELRLLEERATAIRQLLKLY